MNFETLLFDADLISRYEGQGPRYTSYPTAPQFHERFDSSIYRSVARRSNDDPRPAPLSLYVHVPFCDTVCYYCACNKIATRNRQRGTEYVDRLIEEIAEQGTLFDRQRPVDQLHWGGGTPTFLDTPDIVRLMASMRRHFTLRDGDTGEYSIEIDPRTVTPDRIGVLRDLGFNRISFGVQDFDPEVQRAVNRIQSEAQTVDAMAAARHHGFSSISVDLIYGLPHQTAVRFERTLGQILALRPDRMSIFNYAHLPQMFKVQQQIDESALPPAAEKLRILKLAVDLLTSAGYRYIGMDHFALPDDELARAQALGTLSRNFQGYSTHGDCDVIGLGVSAISRIGDSYAQNDRQLDHYYSRLSADRLAVFRGVELSKDDVIRRDVILALICQFELDFKIIEDRHAIRFEAYFADELAALAKMQSDGLLRVGEQGVQVNPGGRLLIRNICMVFDIYLRTAQRPARFSKVI